MKVTITKEVFRRFNPKFKIAFIKIEEADNNSKLKESAHLLKEVSDLIKLTFNKEELKNHHMISTWTTAQEEFGKDAKHYHTSVEVLMKKVLSGKKIITKNVIENITNHISLKHIIPIGTDNYEKIDGNLTFKISKGKEKPNMIQTVKKGALICCDQNKKNNLLSTKFDTWKNKRTGINKKSKNVLIHIESLPPITTKKFNEIVKETTELIKTFTNGKVTKLILDQKNNSGEI